MRFSQTIISFLAIGTTNVFNEGFVALAQNVTGTNATPLPSFTGNSQEMNTNNLLFAKKGGAMKSTVTGFIPVEDPLSPLHIGGVAGSSIIPDVKKVAKLGASPTSSMVKVGKGGVAPKMSKGSRPTTKGSNKMPSQVKNKVKKDSRNKEKKSNKSQSRPTTMKAPTNASTPARNLQKTTHTQPSTPQDPFQVTKHMNP